MKTEFSGRFKKRSSNRGIKPIDIGRNAHNAKLGHSLAAFTLVEAIIVLAICSIFIMIVINIFASNYSHSTMGINGFIETRCIGGYQFAVGNNGSPEQILNEEGQGIPCER